MDSPVEEHCGMERHVVVSFGPSAEFEYLCDHPHAAVGTNDEAWRWLDREFVALECEVVTPTGKVLIADKILAVARCAGERRFATDNDWSNQFACSAVLALKRDFVRVDVAENLVSY